MKRLWLWAWDWIVTIGVVVFILGACAVYSLWDNPFGDDTDGGGW